MDVLQEGMDTREMSIPQNVYTGPGHQLFDFLATKLRDFILEHTKGCVLFLVGICLFTLLTTYGNFDDARLLRGGGRLPIVCALCQLL